MWKARAGVDPRPAIAVIGGKARHGRPKIEFGKRVGDGLQIGRRGKHIGQELLVDRQLDVAGGVLRLGDASFEPGQFRGGEAHGVGHGLAVDEARCMRFGQKLLALRGGHLDEIADDVVVLDPEGADIGLAGEPALQFGHDLRLSRASARSASRVVEIAVANESAVARQKRRLLADRVQKLLRQCRVAADREPWRPSRQPCGRLGSRSRIAARSRAPAMAAPMARRSRGPPRPRVRRVRARVMSGTARRLWRSRPPRSGALDHVFDHVEPGIDGGGIDQRRRKPPRQQPRAGSGYGLVHGGAQGTARFAAIGHHQFERRARGRIDGHDRVGATPLRRAQGERRALLRVGDIGDQRPERRAAGPGIGGRVRPDQSRGDAQRPLFGIKELRTDDGQSPRQLGPDQMPFVKPVPNAFGDEKLGRIDPGEFVAKRIRSKFGQECFSGRYVGRSDGQIDFAMPDQAEC